MKMVECGAQKQHPTTRASLSQPALSPSHPPSSPLQSAPTAARRPPATTASSSSTARPAPTPSPSPPPSPRPPPSSASPWTTSWAGTRPGRTCSARTPGARPARTASPTFMRSRPGRRMSRPPCFSGAWSVGTSGGRARRERERERERATVERGFREEALHLHFFSLSLPRLSPAPHPPTLTHHGDRPASVPGCHSRHDAVRLPGGG